MLVYLLFCVGLVMLLLGGEWLVKGAVGLAEKLGISPLIIGLTIVAFGTSAPELFISLKAAFGGSGGLAVGNVVGSNIANVLLVLGGPALITAIYCADKELHKTLLLVIGVTIAFMVQLAFGPLSRWDGLLLLVVLIGFLAQQFVTARQQSAAQNAAADADYHDEVGDVPTNPKTIAGLLLIGIITLPLGANITVDSATEIALRWLVPEEVIGLTIVAIGTSLPELATGIMAARQGNTSVAIGNVVGSNLFNIAAIMGITAAVVGNVDVGSHIVSFDMWIMLAATLLLAALIYFKVSINRTTGGLLLAAYCVYLAATSFL